MSKPAAEQESSVLENRGARIREIRKRQKMSMQDLADLIGDGTHFTTIAKLETGRMKLTLDWAEKIANAFNLSFNELLSDRFSKSEVKAVPLLAGKYPGPDLWKNIVTAGWAPSILSSDKAFAIPIGGASDQFESEPSYWIVIDPEKQALMVDTAYAVVVGESELTYGLFRLDPPRFDPFLVDRPSIIFGKEPFTLVGEVTWINRLPPRRNS